MTKFSKCANFIILDLFRAKHFKPVRHGDSTFKTTNLSFESFRAALASYGCNKTQRIVNNQSTIFK